MSKNKLLFNRRESLLEAFCKSVQRNLVAGGLDMPGLPGHLQRSASLHTALVPSWHQSPHPPAPERQQRQQRRCSACSARSSGSEPHSASGLASIPQPTELRLIRGVGPKNEALLLSKGHTTLRSLQNVFQESSDADLAKFKSYLEVTLHRGSRQSSVI